MSTDESVMAECATSMSYELLHLTTGSGNYMYHLFRHSATFHFNQRVHLWFSSDIPHKGNYFLKDH